MARGETSEAGDAEARMQWLNAHLPPKPVAAPKVGFRASPRVIGTRPEEIRTPDPTPAPAHADESTPAETRAAKTNPAKPKLAEPAPAATRTAESRPPKATPAPIAKTTAPSSPAKITAAKTTPAPVAKTTPDSAGKATPAPIAQAAPKATPAPVAKLTPPAAVAPSSTAKAATPAPVAKTAPKATPAPIAQTAPHPAPKTTPAPIAKLTPPSAVAPSSTPKPVSTAARATPAPKLALTPAITAIPASNAPATRPRTQTPVASTSTTSGRYPWKTGIVTTVFWIGEPSGGNNSTPNRASSWDARWTQSYGGYDTPDPSARRNFIPVRFTPRQNPFYVALPYNDVTRGNFKPEARRVIPWFREAFHGEGQSVCRDRWIAIRNRAGRTVYAQWSDCGPFRTDHWQYVFGSEKPRPNLNQGAGLDVSPAVRDYLGIDSTDVTDWKFVDFREVPPGPWALYGNNNTFVLREARGTRSAAATSRTRKPDYSGRIRVGEL